MNADRRMVDDRKISLLSSFTEEQLRTQVLIPLLKIMGLANVKEYHGGVPEKGKDIVGHYSDLLGARHHVAIIIKRGDIHGAVGKPGSASEVLYQVEQALSEPFSDVYDLEPIDINECWVVTNGLIKNTAIESIRGKLNKTNLDKVTRFIDREKLVDLLDLHWPTYWLHDRILLMIAHDMKSRIVSARNKAHVIADYHDKMPIKKIIEYAINIEDDLNTLAYMVETIWHSNCHDINCHLEQINAQHEVLNITKMLCRSEDKKIRVEFKYPSIVMDARAFRQCVFNLLRNALQYSKGSSKDIEISDDIVGGNYLIRVRDFGIGIPEGWEDLIFEYGTRATNAISASVIGPGIGLWLSRRLVHLNGGKLLLTSRANPTEFTMYIPTGKKS